MPKNKHQHKISMKLNKYVLMLAVMTILLNGGLSAQLLKPIEWSSQLSQKEAQIGQTIELVFKAEIEDKWYLYSTDFDPDLGPVVTTFSFKPNSSYELVGKIQPINAKKKYDAEIWDGEYTYFKKNAELRQKIKILSKDFKVEVSNEYQVCSEIDGKCILLEDEFTFQNLKISSPKDQEEIETQTAERNKDELEETPAENIAENPTDSLEKDIENTKSNEDLAENSSRNEVEAKSEERSKAENYTTKPIGTQGEESLLSFLLVAFGAGLIALLTPCVYPMIPMTVSFFTSRSKSRGEAISKALVYGLSIVAIYTFIGLVVSAIFGAEFANIMATHWLPNVLFFLIFVIFALSFFGLFELIIPSSLVNQVDAKADKGGYVGIFFMAFVLVLVSFSCTGPIIGSILVAAANGEFLRPVLGMLACSMAFAIPFTLFAMFPSWMQNLPQSGGWLNSVKVVLGFVELALAFKFLSTADQVYHWGILDRDIYLSIWIAIALLMGLYLLGKIRLPHDSPMEKISVGRLILATATFSFMIYMIPGLFGAPLSLLSGLLPPRTTLEFDLTKNTNVITDNQEFEIPPKYADFLHFPHGLKGYFDYEEARQAAQKANKPLFIDFTGHGCVNCRKMEDNVWANPEVLKRLRNDYIIVALYIDERFELPKEEQYISKTDGKKKTTLGKKNSDLQITKFGNNAQPFYVLLGHENEKPLVTPQAYDPDVQEFVRFLDKGVEEFKKQQK